MRIALLLLLLQVVACSSRPRSPARGRYNHGIELLAEGELDRAETAFLDARSEAGADQSLRYSTAFNLGMLHVRRADELEVGEPAEALAELQNARNWFQDAASVRSDDEDARSNLQIVALKAQVLADQLNQGERSLEARLDKVIANERTLRDQVRSLMEAVQKAGENADPIGFRDAFAALAIQERELMADAGVVSDQAADELAGLDGQDPEQMQQQDRVRQMQLRNLDSYLQSARIAIDDSRRELRNLDGKRSHLRATAALALLKRAREQLLDPVAALKGVAQDQGELLSHTEARLALGETQGVIPAWLDTEHLSERQNDTLERTSEVLMRFQAASEAPPPEDPGEVDPKMARMLAMATLALPFLENTVASMNTARESLSADTMDEAVAQEIEAMRNLMRAIEHFSDLRNLIELAYAEQQGVLRLLDPEQVPEHLALAEMGANNREEESFLATQRNVDRVTRMRALIVEQRAEAVAAAAQGGDEAQAGAGQTFDQAEQFRSAAEAELTTLLASLQSISDDKKPVADAPPPLESASQAQTQIEELRRIFYTIVEHLKELHRDQSETYDSTGELQATEDADRAALLPPLAETQGRHAALAEALADALEQQADAASASEDPKAAQEAEKFAAAATEVRAALESLRSASRALSQALEDASSMSVDLSPALVEQPLGLEHIAAAIEILEPPQDQNQDQEEDQQEQDQEDQQQQEQEEVSKQQADRRLQEIRDREAARQREREKTQATEGGSVEKDW